MELPDRGIVIKLGNGVEFHRPQDRIREYCAIEVYRDRNYAGGYDDHVNVTDGVSREDFEAANNIRAGLTLMDQRRILGNAELSPRLAAVRDMDLGEVGDDQWDSVKRGIGSVLSALLSVPNLDLSKAMKIFHVKRPHLVPVLDSLVVRFLTGNDTDQNRFSQEELMRIGIAALEAARTDLRENSAAFAELEERLADLPTPLPVVRLYDILCWTQEKWVSRGDTGARYGVASASLDQGAYPAEPLPKPMPASTGSNLRDAAEPLRGEIGSTAEFRQIVARAEGVIVITGTNPPRIHRPLCELVTEERFQNNIILNRTKNVKYYSRNDVVEARREFGAVACKRCRP